MISTVQWSGATSICDGIIVVAVVVSNPPSTLLMGKKLCSVFVVDSFVVGSFVVGSFVVDAFVVGSFVVVENEELFFSQ